ncbi:MAG: helix-turn-helix domain-containing protein [Ghiorsea sp.]
MDKISVLRINQQVTHMGAAILAARKQQGLTQDTFAKKLGVAIPTLRKLETGDISIALGTCLYAMLLLKIETFPRNKPCRSPLPHIPREKSANLEKKLILQGVHASDAENAVWVLSLSPQQRFQALINQEKEQRLCGIALP